MTVHQIARAELAQTAAVLDQIAGLAVAADLTTTAEQATGPISVLAPPDLDGGSTGTTSTLWSSPSARAASTLSLRG
ncbi:MAG TPA: hypothetical protein VIL55_15630 [Naasia sp.]|jgi:hypothetical protein